jgi:UDP-4-amino-4-deoxy-L-arabinose-oxoglutarate aminotransferase
MKVEFCKHNIYNTQLLEEVLSGIMLAQGPQVEAVEEWFKQYIGVSNAVAMNSCTNALWLAMVGMGLQREDEVITTPLTFVATANAIMMAGAKPVFADVDPATGLIDLDAVEAAITSKTVGILPVHLYGQMVDMLALKKIADAHNLFVLEDAAHCIEGRFGDIKPGMVSDGACFSFYATKNVTCGDGGMFVTSKDDLARAVRMLRLHGIDSTAAQRHAQEEHFQHWDMVEFGYKANMTDIEAALLLPQLNVVDELWKKRNWLSELYYREFSIADIPMPTTDDRAVHAHHLFTVLIDRRDEVAASVRKAGIGVTVNYRPVHLSQYYKHYFGYRDGAFPRAERIGACTMSLPLYPRLTVDELYHVAKVVRVENAVWNR